MTKRPREEQGELPSFDRDYFEAYGDLGIHETMLRDTPRTLAYRNAIVACRSQIEGKVVLDVGGGTGILSIFAAKDGGAKKVYCVDASEVVKYAEMIIKSNGLEEIIQVIQGKIEEIDLPEKVDVIVSEWMGYFLVFESMLDSVIVARDRFLKPGGLIMPQHAKLYLTTMTSEELYETRLAFWSDVKKLYGVDMSCLIPFAKQQVVKEVLVEVASPEEVLGEAAVIADLDLATLKLEDLKEIKCEFSISTMLYGKMHGFLSWFDVTFPVPGSSPVVLSTSPFEMVTHWKSVLFFADCEKTLRQDQKVLGAVRIRKGSRNPRCIDMDVSFKLEGDEHEHSYSYTISDNPSLDMKKTRPPLGG